MYVEDRGGMGSAISSGLAIANNSPDPVTVGLTLQKLDVSSPPSTAALVVPGNGQVATFLKELPEFRSLETPFKGILSISSSAEISVIGLRGRDNERSDFLITTTPPVPTGALPGGAESRVNILRRVHT